jgi:hypothetical protein
VTPIEFRAALSDLGLTQAELGRQLAEQRPETKPTSWARAVRAWANGERRVPVEMAWALRRMLAPR